MKANNNKNHDAQEDFNTKMSKGPQTRADIETELGLLKSTMHEVEIKYHESKEKHEKELFTYDQRFRTINETALMVRQDRDIKKIQLKGMERQVEADRLMEKQLDKEIESILGRAVTQEDLDALYQQDIGLLNQIEAGLDNKIESYK